METCLSRDQFLATLRTKYQKVRELLDPRDNVQVPESEIILNNRNEAIDILKEMRVTIENTLNEDEERDETLNSMLAVIWLDLGVVSIDSEELKIGEDYLMRCIGVLAGKEQTSSGLLPVLTALNHLGIVWYQWSNPKKAEFFLKRAETLYKEYTDSENDRLISMMALFNLADNTEPSLDEVLDKLHTLTLYYLAQIYGAIKDHCKSGEYCHMTLQRQLCHQDLDHIDWSLNAATLAQFFMEQQDFCQARHHLAAASFILKKYEIKLNELSVTGNNDEVTKAKWERFRHRSADVARCWAKYGILLMNASRERLINLSESTKGDGDVADSTDSDFGEKQAFVCKQMKFISIEKDIESIAGQVTDQYLLDFNDARKVFLNIQHWLKESQTYYDLESHASDYVQIVEDMSQSFKSLCFYEDNDERQAKMHKRRIDLLTTLVSELNPQYYQAECRQMWIELAETYSEILNIKLDKLRASNERPVPHALSKINNLATSAIGYYQRFLDSLKKPENPPGIIKFSDEMVRPALYAYFHLGTLYNKIITPDKHVQLENIKNSIEAYKSFIDHCQSSEELIQCMAQELNVCKDLVKLLPLKMNKLIRETSAK